MTLVLPVPGRVRIAVPAGSSLEAAARSLELPHARVEVVSLPVSWTPDAVERLVDGGIDHLVVFDRALPAVPGPELRAALDLLRTDATTAAVGPSATGGSTGDLELASLGPWLLVRAAALRPLAPWVTLDAPAGWLDLCARLWVTGNRVRTIADPSAAVTERPSADAVIEALRALDPGGPSSSAPAEALRRRHLVELAPIARRWLAGFAAAGGPTVDLPIGEVRATRVLVITADVLAPSMAGPAIRAVALATALAREHDVRLVSTERCDLTLPTVPTSRPDERALKGEVDWADVVVFQGWIMAGRPWLRDSTKIIVTDLYDPMHLEQLEHGREAEGELGRVEAVRRVAATLNEQMRRADFALCASAEQRQLWVGALATLGRVNPVTYDDEPSLGRLIDIVPFGVPDEPMGQPEGAIKGVVPGIGLDDPVILWGGGVYNWFDPLTLVRAVERLRGRVPNIRLFFLGLAHPNPSVPAMRMANDLRSLSDELGLTGVHVFFNDGWVDHDQRSRYLVDADIGVSTHFHHIETEFSFRTRILDYLWAGLPVVATDGDGFAVLLRSRDAGRIVPAEDVDALEAALAELILDDAVAARCREGSRSLAAELTWSRNVEPLLEFCRAPRRAPDVACPLLDATPDTADLRKGWRRDLQAARAYLRAGGIGAVTARLRARAARR